MAARNSSRTLRSSSVIRLATPSAASRHRPRSIRLCALRCDLRRIALVATAARTHARACESRGGSASRVSVTTWSAISSMAARKAGSQAGIWLLMECVHRGPEHLGLVSLLWRHFVSPFSFTAGTPARRS